MKRIIAIALILVIGCLCFCGCGSSEESVEEPVKAKVINNDGETEYLTKDELEEIKSGNGVYFKKKYWCSHVTVTEKISKVYGATIINGSRYDWCIYADDWMIGCVQYSKSNISSDFIASLNPGDTVEISGELTAPGVITNGELSVVKK